MEAIVAGVFETKDEAKPYEFTEFTAVLNKDTEGKIQQHLEK